MHPFCDLSSVADGNEYVMGIGMKSLKWEVIGTKNLFPHISTVKACMSPDRMLLAATSCCSK